MASAQTPTADATAIDVIVIVDGKLAPPGTAVDIIANGVVCTSAVTVARNVPMTVGSVLKASLSGAGAPCATGAALSARVGQTEGALPTPTAGGVIGGALILGRPVALIEGTATQTGDVQPAPDIQIVVGSGPAQRVCARAPLVPPVPGVAAGTPAGFAELLLDPAAGCAKLGDRVDLYVGDTLAESITATAGLTNVQLSVHRVVNSLEDNPQLPATGNAGVRSGGVMNARAFVLLALAALLALASGGWLARAAFRRRM